MSIITVKCLECGGDYKILTGRDRARSLCKSCRPAPKAVIVKPDDGTIGIKAMAEVLDCSVAYMTGIANRRYNGISRFTPELVDQITMAYAQ